MKVGTVYPNRKALCEELGCEYIVSGSAKKAQDKHFANFFEYYKEGHKLVITKVFGKYVDRVAGERSSRWNFEISLQLYAVLKNIVETNVQPYRNAPNALVITNLESYALVGLVNKNFKGLATNEFFDETARHMFVNAASSSFYAIIRDVLNSMHNKGVINYVKTFAATIAGEHRVVTNEEATIIRGVHSMVLNEMKLCSLKEVYVAGRVVSEQFYDRVNELLSSLHSFMNCYVVHYIGFTEANVTHFGRVLLTEGRIALAKDKIRKESIELLETIVDNKLLTPAMLAKLVNIEEEVSEDMVRFRFKQMVGLVTEKPIRTAHEELAIDEAKELEVATNYPV